MAATNTIIIGARNLVHLISTFYPSPLLEKGQVSKVTVVLRTENATTVLFMFNVHTGSTVLVKHVGLCLFAEYTLHILCVLCII